MTSASLLLASGSPRRALLLRAAGFSFSVVAPDVDETPGIGEAADAYVLRLSQAKADAVPAHDATVVLAADTTVVLDGTILGKPDGHEEAVTMLEGLAGRSHVVLTGWTARCGVASGAERFGVAESIVRFRPRSRAELAEYVTRTEPYDKAGAYGIQGDDGWLIASVDGSRSNVMGLPVGEVVPALVELGVERRSAADGR